MVGAVAFGSIGAGDPVYGTGLSGTAGGAGAGRTIGTDGFSDNLTADVSELLEYGAQTTMQQASLRNNEKSYFGTP